MGAEIRQGQAVQAIQLCLGGVLPGRLLEFGSLWLTDQCNWDVADDAPPIATTSSPKTDPARTETTIEQSDSPKVRVSYLTEQTSHHPPVSAFYVDCPERGVSARGFDQLSAKFTGTSIRVTPGAHNLGIFINIAKRDNEEYQLTHPAAQLGGILRGALAVTVADLCYITCPKTRIKVILHYVEEGWLGKTQNRVQGVIFHYDPENDKHSRIKDVPSKDILATLEGSWQEQVYYTLSPNARGSDGPSEKQLLIDLIPLLPAPKIIPAEEDQLPNESRRFWHDVTTAIVDKHFADATRAKQAIEQSQRDKAEDRKSRSEEWQPVYFTGAVLPKGRPDLNDRGRAVLKGLQEGNYRLQEPEVAA